MEKLKLDRENLRKFGITMGTAFLVISLLVFWKRGSFPFPLSYISLAFFVLAFAIPRSLKLLYILWMKLAFVLSWVNTRIILVLMFYLLFTPISLVMRLLGKDLLERKIEKDKESYWHKKEQRAGKEHYEKLF
jgi:multisubunit Na+/H+ antiporter MnhG subunit